MSYLTRPDGQGVFDDAHAFMFRRVCRDGGWFGRLPCQRIGGSAWIDTDRSRELTPERDLLFGCPSGATEDPSQLGYNPIGGTAKARKREVEREGNRY